MNRSKIPIERLEERLREDKERLRKIIDRLHEAGNSDQLNDRLIKGLSMLEFDDDRQVRMVEFIILILTNTATTNRTHFISVLEEFTNAINHNLEFSTHVQEYINNRFEKEKKIKEEEDLIRTKSDRIVHKIIEKILPTTKVGNTLMWVLVLIVAVNMLLGVDYIKNTITTYIEGQSKK